MDVSATSRLPAVPSTKEKEESPTLTASEISVALLAGMSDEVLMAQLSEGNREALAILFSRYARTVRSIAYRAVHDAAEADDLVQDTFLLVYRDSKGFDSAKGSARGWVFQIAHRRAISRHRYLSSRHFYNRVDLDDAAGELSEPKVAARRSGESIEEMFGEAGFRRVFEELSLNQRETLRLHFFEGYTLAEIAAKLGQSRSIPGKYQARLLPWAGEIEKTAFSRQIARQLITMVKRFVQPKEGPSEDWVRCLKPNPMTILYTFCAVLLQAS
jgi:RNA polymerase sigma-70 factor, ECF subfamily